VLKNHQSCFPCGGGGYFNGDGFFTKPSFEDPYLIISVHHFRQRHYSGMIKGSLPVFVVLQALIFVLFPRADLPSDEMITKLCTYGDFSFFAS
jgi:hypothetical protein